MVKYFIGTEEHIIANGEDITEAVKATEAADEKRGYDERMAGYYDKWYRYNRHDNGAAYDKGVARAANGGKCMGDMIIIPCMG